MSGIPPPGPTGHAGPDQNYAHIDEQAYQAKFGSYRPNFVGKPPNYYPNTFHTYCCALLGILTTIGVSFALFIGLLQPCLKDSYNTGWAFTGLFILYVAIIILAVFFGGRERKRKEEELINKKYQEQQKEQHK